MNNLTFYDSCKFSEKRKGLARKMIIQIKDYFNMLLQNNAILQYIRHYRYYFDKYKITLNELTLVSLLKWF